MNLDHELIIPPSGITTRIVLLSLLSSRPMHGYELRQVLEQRHMHRWANIQYGSIYRGLQQMTREGLLEEEGEEREGNRPPRTVFKITEQGKEELKNLLRQVWREPALLADPVDLALSLVMYLPKAEILDLLRQRLEKLDAIEAHVRQAESYFANRDHQPPQGVCSMIGDVFLHRRYILDAERRWTQHIIERLENGAYDLTEDELQLVLQYRSKPFNPAYNSLIDKI
jgi:DNA-binding PadR family transcriptional regulator